MMGLGSARKLKLAKAREIALEMQEAVVLGKDPVAAREERRSLRMTVGEAAIAYLEGPGKSFAPNTVKSWNKVLNGHVLPALGTRVVTDVTVESLVELLRPIWRSKPETAKKARIVIWKILQLGFARMKVRDAFNPATWKGNLEIEMPEQREGRHQPSLDYRDMPAFVKRLRAIETFGAKGLEFLILTACRPVEACEGRWSEIEGAVWVIPRERMKTRKKAHRVPLSPQALRAIEGCRTGEFLFLGNRTEGISTSALLKLTKKLNPQITVHGFRASFREWATEHSGAQWRDVETCLAHVVKTKTEKPYARSDRLEARRKIMCDWADFLEKF
jgi:integrase